jgi:hypothetical protein
LHDPPARKSTTQPERTPPLWSAVPA